MKKLVLFLTLSVIVFSAVFVFYAHKNATDKVVIGMLSGINSDYRLLRPFRNGLRLATEEWNANGGINGKRISLIMADEIEFYSWWRGLWDILRGNISEYYPGVAASYLVRKHTVSAFFYYDAYHPTCALFGFQERGIPVISPTILVGENDYFFNSRSNQPSWGIMGARFVYEELGLKKSAVIFDVSSDFDKNIAIDFQSKFESLGGKVVLFEGFQPEAINIEQFLKKTINLESEIIFLTPRSFRHDLAKGIIDKSRELNYTGYFLGHGIWAYSNGVTVEGLTREGSFYLLDFSRENPRPEVQNFINNYRRRYRVNPCLRAAEGYDAANILFEAIKNAGTIDGSGIKEALMNTRIHGVAGLIGFDNNRNSRRAVDFIQVKKGEAIYRSTVFP